MPIARPSRAERGAADAADHAFVVPAYGQSPFLEDCLRSLRAQSIPSRILVATSTPCAHIEAAAAAFDAPVLVNPERRGIAGDWNFALGAAGSRLVTLAHQDDLYFPAFLERSLAAFSARPEAALCFTGYREIGDAGEPKHSKISLAKHGIERVALGRTPAVGARRMRAFLAFGNPLPCSSVTFDRSRLGDIRFSPDYDSNLDWALWLDLLDRGVVFARAPERLVGRRHNALTETSRLLRDGRRAREDARLFRRIWPGPIAWAIACAYKLGY